MLNLLDDCIYNVAEFLPIKELLNFSITSRKYQDITLNLMKPIRHIYNFIKCIETIECNRCLHIMRSYIDFKSEGGVYIKVKYESRYDMIKYIDDNFEFLVKICNNADFHLLLEEEEKLHNKYIVYEDLIWKEVEGKHSSYSRFIAKYYRSTWDMDIFEIFIKHDYAALWYTLETFVTQHDISVPIHGLLLLAYIEYTGKTQLLQACFDNCLHMYSNEFFVIALIELTRKLKVKCKTVNTEFCIYNNANGSYNEFKQCLSKEQTVTMLYERMIEDIYADLQFCAIQDNSPLYVYIIQMCNKRLVQFQGYCSRTMKLNDENVIEGYCSRTMKLNDKNIIEDSYEHYKEYDLIIALGKKPCYDTWDNLDLFKYFRNHPMVINKYRSILVQSSNYKTRDLLATLIICDPNFDYDFGITEDAKSYLIDVVNLLRNALLNV